MSKSKPTVDFHCIMLVVRIDVQTAMVTIDREYTLHSRRLYALHFQPETVHIMHLCSVYNIASALRETHCTACPKLHLQSLVRYSHFLVTQQ